MPPKMEENTEAKVPFPDNVHIAPLLRLSLAKLREGNANEIQQFVRACEDLGFFYLDLRGPGDELLKQADKLFDTGEDLFNLPSEEKMKFNFQHLQTYFGYKHMGAAVADKLGNLDRNEFYNVSKDDIFGIGRRWPAPTLLDSRRGLVKSFMSSANVVVGLVLQLLNDHLGLPQGTLQSIHRPESQSGDHVRFIKAPPQPVDD
ncbi:hypothetical protein ACQRIU_006971 [Beauveria bassiana]